MCAILQLASAPSNPRPIEDKDNTTQHNTRRNTKIGREIAPIQLGVLVLSSEGGKV